MMSSAKLLKDVQKWGYERGIIQAENAHRQTMKTIEETGELAGAIVRHNRESAVDAFGDILVTMIMHNECLGGKLDFILLDGIENPLGFVPDVYTAMYEFTAQIGKMDYYASGIYDRVQALEVLRRATAEHFNSETFPTLIQCLQIAYNEIKDRQGKMEGGVFIKESDLQSKAEEPTPAEEEPEEPRTETEAETSAVTNAVEPPATDNKSTETSRVVKRKSRKKKDAE